MPEKYRRLADFESYYNGTKRAPVLTIFIGGNHEASNYLHELYYPTLLKLQKVNLLPGSTEDG